MKQLIIAEDRMKKELSKLKLVMEVRDEDIRNRIINELLAKYPEIDLEKKSKEVEELYDRIRFEIEVSDKNNQFSLVKPSMEYLVYNFFKNQPIRSQSSEGIYRKLKRRILTKQEILNMIFFKSGYVNYDIIPYDLSYKEGIAILNGVHLFRAKNSDEVIYFLRGIIKNIFYKMKKNEIPKDDSFLKMFPIEVISTVSIRKEYQELGFKAEMLLFRNEIKLESIEDYYKYLNKKSKEYDFIEVGDAYEYFFDKKFKKKNLEDNRIVENKIVENKIVENKIKIYKRLHHILNKRNEWTESEIRQFINTLLNLQVNKKTIVDLNNYSKLIKLISTLNTPSQHTNNQRYKYEFVLEDYSYEDLIEEEKPKKVKKSNEISSGNLEEEKTLIISQKCKELLLKLILTIIRKEDGDTIKLELLEEIERTEAETASLIVENLIKFVNISLTDTIIPTLRENRVNHFIDGFVVMEKKHIYLENELLSKNLNIHDKAIKEIIENLKFNEGLKSSLENYGKVLNKAERNKLKKRLIKFLERIKEEVKDNAYREDIEKLIIEII